MLRGMSKREEWEQLVGAYEASVASQRRFAEEQGLSVHTLRYWLSKFRSERVAARQDEAEPRLLPVTVVGSVVEEASSVRVHFGDLSVCADVGTAPAYVASLVTALRAC